MRNTRILFIANIYSHHIYNFASKLKENHPLLQIDIFNINYQNTKFPLAGIYDKIISPKQFFPKFIYKIPKLRAMIAYIDAIIAFKKGIDKNYDVINIHNLTPFAFFVRNKLKAISNKVVVTPFGSDILRANKINYLLFKCVFEKTDYVTVMPTAVRTVLIDKFKIPVTKFIELDYGSDVIDMIMNNNSINKSNAKKHLGIDGCYSIICGYNGYETQNHLQIIEAINNIKADLPENFKLVFPMTYGAPNGYIEKIENDLKNKNIKYLILKQFLAQEEIVYIRLCADIFIHAQPTDNLSSSICESLLCDTHVINASWIKYPLLETFGIPYAQFESFKHLEDIIIKVCTGIVLVDKKQETIEYVRQIGRSNMIIKWNAFYKHCAESN